MNPMRRRSLLARMVSNPARMKHLPLADWDLLLRQARCADLLPRLAALADAHLKPREVPDAARPHLSAARSVHLAQLEEVRREADALEALLQPLGVPVVLLKGAAYLLDRGPAALGRTLTDLDILVPRHALSEVESALLIGGWNTTHPDAYDQAYYRRWMHELPPMVHSRRGTALDVHHAILPPTARTRTDSTLILQAATALPGRSLLQVPCPLDQVLHSMAHLLFNEDLSHGLRDLSDIDLMLRHHGAVDSFWSDLTARAQRLCLESVLLHGLHQSAWLLDTPVPAHLLEAHRSRAGLARMARGCVDALWHRALDTHHPSACDTWSRVAQGLLFARAHALRMPAGLLIRHLTIKLGRRLRPPPSPLHA